MDNYYINNLESGKIEMYFDKDDYSNLTEDQRKSIRSNFLFSRQKKAWVSRCKYPNLYRPLQVAKALGLMDKGETGERLTFAEEQERKAERAERRAERYEYKAENAEKRGEELQKPINGMHGDIAFFTQPNINTSSGRAFTRQRNRMFDAWERGFEEFKKSEYYQECAEKARRTATGKGQDKAFCQRRIEEAEASIRGFKRNIDEAKGYIESINRGETPKNKYGWEIDVSIELCEKNIDYYCELMEREIEKVVYYKERIEEMGGIQFNKDNINKGDILLIKHWNSHIEVEVINKGTKNITYVECKGRRIKYQCPYSEIIKVVRVADENKEEEMHPFKVGDTFTCAVWVSAERAMKNRTFTIVKTTKKSVTFQYGDEKPFIRKPKINQFDGKWYVCVNDSYSGTFYKEA